LMITQQEVEHVGSLARIEISDEKQAKYAENLSEIIDYVAELESAPTEKIEIINQISGLENVARLDEIKTSLPITKVLMNAPQKEGNFIKVKKIFE